MLEKRRETEKEDPLYRRRDGRFCTGAGTERDRSVRKLQSGGDRHDGYDVLHDDGDGKVQLFGSLHVAVDNAFNHGNEGLRNADEDAAFYEEMLRLFAGQAAEKQTGPEELLDSLRGIAAGETDPEAEEKLYDQIVGVCHTLKGEARGLGAAELGESFYRMELAARVRDRMQLEEFGQKARSQWKKPDLAIFEIFTGKKYKSVLGYENVLYYRHCNSRNTVLTF